MITDKKGRDNVVQQAVKAIDSFLRQAFAVSMRLVCGFPTKSRYARVRTQIKKGVAMGPVLWALALIPVAVTVGATVTTSFISTVTDRQEVTNEDELFVAYTRMLKMEVTDVDSDNIPEPLERTASNIPDDDKFYALGGRGIYCPFDHGAAATGGFVRGRAVTSIVGARALPFFALIRNGRNGMIDTRCEQAGNGVAIGDDRVYRVLVSELDVFNNPEFRRHARRTTNINDISCETGEKLVFDTDLDSDTFWRCQFETDPTVMPFVRGVLPDLAACPGANLIPNPNFNLQPGQVPDPDNMNHQALRCVNDDFFMFEGITTATRYIDSETTNGGITSGVFRTQIDPDASNLKIEALCAVTGENRYSHIYLRFPNNYTYRVCDIEVITHHKYMDVVKNVSTVIPIPADEDGIAINEVVILAERGLIDPALGTGGGGGAGGGGSQAVMEGPEPSGNPKNRCTSTSVIAGDDDCESGHGGGGNNNEGNNTNSGTVPGTFFSIELEVLK